MPSTFQQKVKTVAGYLPANGEIFLDSAQFQTTQQVSNQVKLKCFQQNIQLIAKMLTQFAYMDKQAQEIEDIDVIGDLSEWLASGVYKFKLSMKEKEKQQPKVMREERNLEKRMQGAGYQQQQQQYKPTEYVTIQTLNNGINKMQQQQQLRTYNQQQQQQQFHLPQQNIQQQLPQQPVYTHPQSRPQSYYQTQPAQGRQNTIKYTAKQPQAPFSYPNPHNLTKQQINMKKAQYQKLNVMWIDSLSKCLTYPEKRFYLMPQMHPKRKY